MKGCEFCKHFKKDLSCTAYPKGIPWPILSGEVAHDKPLNDDNGIQFEPIEDKPNA